ncbi:hypothetical protein QCA50_004547 [Cerrena zonata]|uniref:BTB domain-containing protein n=1 Tax=Cerrena zonata TaxID=2478898 RepID=A0AAW0GM52_9APHY
MIKSSDRVFFHVHRHRLHAVSNNEFDGLLTDPNTTSTKSASIIPISETSDVVNVLLHTVYGISCSEYNPSVAVLIATITALKKYGISLRDHINPATPLFPVLTEQAQMHGIELYMVAAENDLQDMAVAISAHLLSFHLPTVTDEMAARMGPIYLKKLFFLHIDRTHVLQELMMTPPETHSPMADCGLNEQQRLMRVWALACASLAWDARPDLSPAKMEIVLGSTDGQLPCQLCNTALNARIKKLIADWKHTQQTI